MIRSPAPYPYDTRREKRKWPPGPWDKEPFDGSWLNGECHCAVIRDRENGTLYGYAGVEPGHIFYGRTTWPTVLLESTESEGTHYCPGTGWFVEQEYTQFLTVHGGVNYMKKGDSNDLWWFGFDTAHAGDLRPSDGYDSVFAKGTHPYVYRDWNYVIGEVNRLAKQLNTAGPFFWITLATPEQKA